MTPEQYKNKLINDALKITDDEALAEKICMMCIDSIKFSLEEYDNFTEKHLKEKFGVEYFSCELQNMDSDFRWVSSVRKLLSEHFLK